MADKPPVRTLPLHSALVAIVVFGMATACSGGESETESQPDPSSSSPVIEGALSTMEDLSSYHLTITPSPPANDPLRSTLFEFDFVAPDKLRVVSTRADGETKQVCTHQSAAGSTSETCRDVLATVTAHTMVEQVSNSEALWYRKCTGAVSTCSGEWQELQKAAIYAPSVGPPYADLPNWHLEALRAARDLVPIEGPDTTGPLIHFQGRFNPIRVSNEAARSFYEDDVVSEDEGCGVSFSVDLVPGATPEVKEECRSGRGITLTERAEAYDASPAPIDIWVSPTDSTIRRLLAVVPQPLPEDPEIRVDVEYSQFNAVEIEFPPEE